MVAGVLWEALQDKSYRPRDSGEFVGKSHKESGSCRKLHCTGWFTRMFESVVLSGAAGRNQRAGRAKQRQQGGECDGLSTVHGAALQGALAPRRSTSVLLGISRCSSWAPA